MMKKIIMVLSAVCLGAFGIHGNSAATEKIVIAGTGDSQSLLRTLARDFEKSHPGTAIEIPDSIGSGGGIKATAMGKSDLGRVARGIKDEEKKYGLEYMLFAKSPLVFAVHPSVTNIDNLTGKEIVGIYSGAYRLWNELGGPENKIYPIHREEGDSSNTVLEERLHGFKDIGTFASKMAYSSPETVDLLVNHKFTFGYGPMSMFKETDMKIIGINGIAPSEDNVNNGSYDLVIDYGIVYRGEPKGLAKKFMDYLDSSDAQRLIRRHGAIPAR